MQGLVASAGQSELSRGGARDGVSVLEPQSVQSVRHLELLRQRLDQCELETHMLTTVVPATINAMPTQPNGDIFWP